MDSLVQRLYDGSRVSYMHCAHLDVLGDICKNNLNLFHSFTVRPSQAGRSLAFSSPITRWTCSFLRGETGDHAAAARGETLNHCRQPKLPSHHKTLSNMDINTDVHTQTLPVPCTSTHTHSHTAFFSFHYKLCFG